MKKNKRYLILVIFSIIVLGILGAMGMYQYGEEETRKFIMVNLIDITSIFVSFFALGFSVTTYFSIDSVNLMTATEGNYLENENYSVKYSHKIKLIEKELKKNKKECVDIKDFEYFWCMELQKRDKSRIFLEFSRYIQKTIDNTIWLNFFECSSEELQESIIIFIKRLIKKAKKFESVNCGLELLLDENIKLIIAIFKIYTNRQSLIKDRTKKKGFLNNRYNAKYVEPKGYDCGIQDVCGEMAKNPISKIVYFHCIGKRFLDELYITLFGNNSLSTHQFFRYLSFDRNKVSNEDKVKMMLEKASQNLIKANSLSDSNILWKAIVSETIAKVKYLNWIIYNTVDSLEELTDQIEIVIKNYNQAYQLFNVAGLDENTYILGLIKEKMEFFDSLTFPQEKLFAV